MGRRNRIEPFTAEMTMLDAATDGRAVARHENQVVFVEGGVPGDVALVHVFRTEKKLLIGRVVELITPSPQRVAAACQHVDLCGGCKWQHLSYEGQLTFKENQVKQVFKRIAKMDTGEFLPILGSDPVFYYRNKTEFSFSTERWIVDRDSEPADADQRALGYHIARSFSKVMDIEECLLHHPDTNAIRNEVRVFARAKNYTFHDHKNHGGLLREIAFKTSVHTGELMVMLVIGEDGSKAHKAVDDIFTHLEGLFPAITHFVWIVNQKNNNFYTDLPANIWKGSEYLTEALGPHRFRIRPTSFFQTNPRQAVVLYDVVKDFLLEVIGGPDKKIDILYDLYSGTGSIGIHLKNWANHVVGIEYVESAVQDARENLKENGLTEGFSFYAGDMKDLLTHDLVAKEGSPQVIVADPPRQGMAPQVVQRLIEMQAPWIIYVSCKPSTQARDIAMMQDYYEIVKLQPVDMFPHTAHVENVALLKLKDVLPAFIEKVRVPEEAGIREFTILNPTTIAKLEGNS
ncbi:MAG: 23S rRNA (uracil(1939)-C(5))-methyltransferase RlmD [Bacteroidia bacterium]|nr:23S rRNA (uracil(1939)-C(5))-methyltransferase RlmD [Bacteroidia bacterium]